MAISDRGYFCYFRTHLNLSRPGDAYTSLQYIDGVISRRNLIYRDYSESSIKFIFTEDM